MSVNWPGKMFKEVSCGAVVTVMVEIAVFPLLDAVMVAVPSATAVTRPPIVTVAMDGFEELYVVPVDEAVRLGVVPSEN